MDQFLSIAEDGYGEVALLASLAYGFGIRRDLAAKKSAQ